MNSILAANVISMGGGALVCVLVSIITSTKSDYVDKPDGVWEETLEIDNPLRPWAEIYARFELS